MTQALQSGVEPGILILSAPSGGGKTSLARALVKKRSDAGITVSHTTRPQRPGETDGEDYHFVDHDTFLRMIEQNMFVEYATVFGNLYGTSMRAINVLVDQGKHAILDIDWQGARIVREKFSNAVSVFVMPPSLEVLEKRLHARRQDSDKIIARRMRAAESEISHKDEFDVIIVNEDFDKAAGRLSGVLDTLP